MANRRGASSARRRQPQLPRDQRGKKADRNRHDDRQARRQRQHALVQATCAAQESRPQERRHRVEDTARKRQPQRATDEGDGRGLDDSCRATRPDPAPIADRIATSRRRAVAWTSCMFTRFRSPGEQQRAGRERIESAGSMSLTIESSIALRRTERPRAAPRRPCVPVSAGGIVFRRARPGPRPAPPSRRASTVPAR